MKDNEREIFTFKSGDLETVVLVMETISKMWKKKGITTFIRNNKDGYVVYYNRDAKPK